MDNDLLPIYTKNKGNQVAHKSYRVAELEFFLQAYAFSPRSHCLPPGLKSTAGKDFAHRQLSSSSSSPGSGCHPR